MSEPWATFDCYGTLIDWERGITDAFAGLLTLPDDAAGALSGSLPEWPPFAEVPDSLSELRSRGWRLAVLSNTDPDLLEASIRRLGVGIEARITVVEAGSYKPAHGHWLRFFEATGADRERHVHIARSLFHDIAPATQLGLRSVWINRADERTDLRPDAEMPDLRGLADALDRIVQR